MMLLTADDGTLFLTHVDATHAGHLGGLHIE
jgi:hypothetical protein